jgi:hypothetical protein
MEVNGYQLIEPDFAGTLSSSNVDAGVYISILCWLVDTIGARPEMQALPVSLELMVASYLGPYPCMALRYQDPAATEDLSHQVEAWSQELVRAGNFRAYFDYITTHSARIKEFAQHYQAEVEAYYTLTANRPVTPRPKQ